MRDWVRVWVKVNENEESRMKGKNECRTEEIKIEVVYLEWLMNVKEASEELSNEKFDECDVEWSVWLLLNWKIKWMEWRKEIRQRNWVGNQREW